MTAPTSHPHPRAFRPGWVEGAAAIGWRVLVVAALGFVLAQAAFAVQTATLAVLVGAFVSATFSPLVGTLRTRPGWTRRRAAAVGSVLTLGTVIGVAALVVLAFVPYVDDLLAAARLGTEGIASQLATLGLPQPVIEAVDRWVTDLQAAAPSIARSLAGSLGSIVTVLLLGGFLAFYLMEDADRLLTEATETMDPGDAATVRERTLAAVGETGAYLRGNVLTATLTAATQGAYLALLGVPLAGPLAVVVFFAAFVPYLGALFSTAVILLVALATTGAATAAVLLVLILVTALAIRRLLDRFIYRGTVRVHPAFVLVIAPAGAALFGIVGLVLAVPIAAAGLAIAPAIREVLDDNSRPRGTWIVPGWLDRFAQLSWRALVIIAVLALAAQTLVAPLLTGPVIVALVIACAAKPATDGLRRRGFGPSLAALTVTTLSALVAIAILAVTVVSLASQLPEILDAALAGAERLVPGEALSGLIGSIQPDLVESSRVVISNVAAVAVALVTAAILTFFFLRDGPGWWSRLLRLVPERRRADLGASGATAARILNGSTLGTGLVSAIAGVLQVLMMTILGLPLAVPIGVLTFFGGFIPYIGGFIATALVVLVAIAVGSPTTVVLVAILTVVNNILIGNLIAPLVLGRTVHLHPAIVLLAAPVGASIGGLAGLFLIVPAIAILQATWRSIVALFVPAGEAPVLDAAPEAGAPT